MVEIHACTIIARNYLPAARVLAKSFTEHNPGCAFTTLIVDDTKFEVDVATEPFEVLRLDEIGIDHDEALRMAAIYDVSELCTAVKPWLLQRLLDDGAPVVVYLDPDIKVYAPLDKIGHLATETGIVLTPHVTRPMPRDGLSKSETEVLWSGIYNLGFIAVSEQAQDFLDFWKERLKRDCISDPENMRFVDQRWVDFAPGLYPVHILRDTSYNVAYWNLDHRNVVFRENRYLVDGNPLHFFHFSGYSPNTPYLLSKHQGHRPRILLSDRPDLARLCDEYGADLLAHGYGEGAGTEYAFNRLPNGIALDLPMRRLHRSALLAAESAGTTLPPNPLEPGGDDEFLAWVTGPADEPPGTRLSRYLRAVYERRQDVQRVFPDPDGVNFQGFATWVHHEVEAGRIEPRLGVLPVPEPRTRVRLETARQLERLRHRLTAVPVPGTGDERVRLNLAGSVQLVERELAKLPVPHSAERARLNLTRSLGRLERRLVAVPVPGTSDERVRLNASRVLGRVQRRLTAVPDAQEAKNVPSPAAANEQEMSPGIRVAGYLRTESGVGQLGRLAVAAAESAGLTTSTYVDTTALSRQAHPFESSAANLDVNLVCVNADELPNFAKRVGPDFFRGHYTIGMWAWELEEFPSRFAAAFDYVDEVWSISRFASKAIAGVSAKPVHTFPIPILQPDSNGASKADLGLPSGFIFLFYFDLLSIFERKNPLGLVRAFSQAFRPGEGPALVIKVVNGQFEAASLERLKLAAGARPDIVIIDSYLDPGTNAALMAACDCYVSLHRSEGFGLTLAEAMALAKPVIATGYSGNMDFMTADTSFLVPWVPGTVPLGCNPYPVGARWAEPDLDAAARIMRQVYEEPADSQEIGRRAQAHVLSNYGLDVSARFVEKRFDSAQRGLNGKRSTKTVRAVAVPQSPALVEVVQQRPPIDAPSNHPRVARAFRRVVFRTLQSHDDFDRALHTQLAAGVDGVSSDVARLGSETARLRKQLGRLREALLRESARLGRLGEQMGERNAALQEGVRALQEGLRAQQESLAVQQQGVRALQERLDLQEERLAEIERTERWQRIDASIRSTDELHAIPYMSDPSLLVTTDEQGRPAIGYRGDGDLGQGLASFEDVFRGPETMIRQRLRPYLPILKDHGPVVDIGCGRGEMLDLLSKVGVTAVGVDLDPALVKFAKGKGHEVTEQDGVEYLVEQPNESLGAIFSSQVIEHLAPDALLRLLGEAHRVLRPDGVMVLETVNPYSIQAFKVFWTDVTHRNPIYPEALLVYCAEAGFGQAQVMFPNGTGELAKDRWSEGEFAVVAQLQ